MFPRRIRETAAYLAAKAFVKRYERLLMPTMLLAGTAIDAAQFRLLDVKTTLLIGGAYALVCGAAMVVMVAIIPPERRIWRYAQLASPFVQQFAIGALLSTSLLFYWFSGSTSVSWPILVLIAVLMFSNEVLRTTFTRPFVQVGLFAFVLFSLFATAAAYAVNSLHPVVFVMGGVASVAVMMAFLVIMLRAGRLEAHRKQTWFTVAGIFAFMNIAYFLNVIPPIPLSLRDAGMYFSVTRQGGDYALVGPNETWWESIIPGQDFVRSDGEGLYAFTAVHAPTALSTTIVHRWETYDEEAGVWTTISRLSFAMNGGREEGYRGYSFKQSLAAGKWRVSVETERGQILGRLPFTVRR